MVQAKTGAEVKKYYEKRYQKEQRGTMRPYQAYLVFLNYLKPKKGKKLLDVGCGTGYFLKAAAKNGLATYGIDFSAQAVKIAKKICPQAKIFQAGAEKLPFKDRSFDYVTCLGSLQYFPHIDKALKEMRRVGKKQAVFCFMVPNANFLFWKLKGKDKKVLWGIEKNILTLEEWQALFKKYGFEARVVGKDDWWAQKKPYLKLLWELLPFNYTYQFIFLCRSLFSGRTKDK